MNTAVVISLSKRLFRTRESSPEMPMVSGLAVWNQWDPKGLSKDWSPEKMRWEKFEQPELSHPAEIDMERA